MANTKRAATRAKKRKSPQGTKKTKKPVVVEVKTIEPGSNKPTQQQIAQKAHELWEELGGDETHNWHEAERILMLDENPKDE